MKKIYLLLFLPLFSIGQSNLTLEDIWGKFAYTAKGARGFNVMNNGTTYLDMSNTEDGSVTLGKFDLKNGKKLGDFVKASDLKFENRELNLETYELSSNEKKLLLYEKIEYVYRRSPKANYFIFDIASKKVTPLSTAGKQMFPKFSPDASKVAFVRDNNLYVLDLATEKETAITTDGVFNQIKNGWADWVYEEEFSKADYFEWSNDGKHLAWVRFDESKVKEFTLDYYRSELYPQKYTFKYPKAGEDNSLVTVLINDLGAGKTNTADIGTFTDIYIPRIKFAGTGELCIQRLNRLQNKLEYLFADPATGKTRVALTEESKTYLDITDDLTFIDKSGFIVTSERDGYNHIYHYDMNGNLVRQITKGEWDVMEFKGYNPVSRMLYFVSTENGAIHRDVYSIKLDGTSKKRMTPRDGMNNADFTNGFRYYINSYSNANTPPVYELYTIDGKLVKVLEDNMNLRERMAPLKLAQKTFMKFKNDAGIELNAWIMKPVDFDSTKKYPVYMYAYNGPGSNECNNGWDGTDYFWHNLLTKEGYIVVCLDGRGTMGRGVAFKHSTYLQLGKYEVEDQIAFAKYLGNKSWIDKNRIGFQGWSYGGYMASLMITKGSDVIKAAIAVAPVTNWKYYDNIYTERFMRTPKDNMSGYEDNSPVKYVKQIKGKFLIIHGSADDNVHMQNSLEMINAMVGYNIPFDMMIYPNKNHGIYGGLTRLHIYSKMLKFVKENL